MTELSAVPAVPQAIRIQDLGRPAICRRQDDAITIANEVECGESTDGWCSCCVAPSCCSTMAALPCFKNPEYITLRHESSKYIYVRENSLEYNEPMVRNIKYSDCFGEHLPVALTSSVASRQITLNKGPCCGVDPCMYDIEDRVSVLYYDNPVFENISDKVTVKNFLLPNR